jgi:hypothetical protein
MEWRRGLVRVGTYRINNSYYAVETCSWSGIVEEYRLGVIDW